MRTTQVVLADLEEAIYDSTMDLDSKPSAVRAGFGMRKSDAALEVPRFRNEYKELVFKNAVFFFPFGNADKVTDFSYLAAKEGGVLTIVATEPYHLLVDKIERTLGQNREFSVNQLVVLNDAIEDLMKGSGKTLQISSRSLTSLESTPDREALIAYVKVLVEGVYGTALVDFYGSEALTNQAVSTRFAGKTLPVLVLESDEASRASLAALAGTSKVLVVNVDELDVIDKATVLDVLKKMAPQKKDKANRSLSPSVEPTA